MDRRNVFQGSAAATATRGWRQLKQNANLSQTIWSVADSIASPTSA